MPCREPTNWQQKWDKNNPMNERYVDRYEAPETEPDETYSAWCSVCNLIITDQTNQETAELLAKMHTQYTSHLVFVSSETTFAYAP